MRRAFLIVGFNNWGKTTLVYDLFGKQRFLVGYGYRLQPDVGRCFTVESHSNDDTQIKDTHLFLAPRNEIKDTHLFFAPRPRFRYPLPHDPPARRPCFALRQTREQKDTHFL